MQIAAPPLLIFWLSGANNAATVRANIMVYFVPQARCDGDVLLERAVHRRDHRAFASARPAIRSGDDSRRLFVSRLSEMLYRRVAYVIIALAGIVSMPVFDALR